jgi:hypothetical protein
LLLPGSGLVKPSRSQPHPAPPPERVAPRQTRHHAGHLLRLPHTNTSRSRCATCQTCSPSLSLSPDITAPRVSAGRTSPPPTVSGQRRSGCHPVTPAGSAPSANRPAFQAAPDESTSLASSRQAPVSGLFRFGVAQKQRDRYLTLPLFPFQALRKQIGSYAPDYLVAGAKDYPHPHLASRVGFSMLP